jgi:hypothetical protein
MSIFDARTEPLANLAVVTAASASVVAFTVPAGSPPTPNPDIVVLPNTIGISLLHEKRNVKIRRQHKAICGSVSLDCQFI